MDIDNSLHMRDYWRYHIIACYHMLPYGVLGALHCSGRGLALCWCRGILICEREIYLNIKIITEHQQPIFSTFTKVRPGFEYLSHCFTETTLYNYPSHTTALGDTVKMLSLQYTLYSDQINVTFDSLYHL